MTLSSPSAYLDGVIVAIEAVDALALEHDDSVLVVVNFLGVEKLAGLEIHDVHVEVVGRAHGQELTQHKHLSRDVQNFPLFHRSPHRLCRADALVPLLKDQQVGGFRGHQRDGRVGGDVDVLAVLERDFLLIPAAASSKTHRAPKNDCQTLDQGVGGGGGSRAPGAHARKVHGKVGAPHG